MDSAREFLSPKDVQVVIHHAPCWDGESSAALLWYHNDWCNDIQFIGLHPKDTLLTPDVRNMITGKRVVMIDITFSIDVITEAASLAEKILIIDHHITAKTNLADLDLDNVHCVIVMDVPGVHLTWNYICDTPIAQMPLPLYYIGLKDVWQHHENQDAVYFTTAFEKPETLIGWGPYITNPVTTATTVIEKGKIIYAYNRSVLKTMMEKVEYTTWRGFTVAMVNVPFPWISDIGAMMCEKDPENTIAVVWNKQPSGPYSVSLRTHNPKGPNCEKIAHEFKGGGHVHGAGLRLDKPPFEIFTDNNIFSDK